MLSAYLDGELRPEARTSIDAHLGVCKECAGLLRELSDIKGLFKISGGYQAPYGFSTRVLAAAREERSKRSWWGRRLVLAAEGFAVAAVVIAGIMTGSLVLNTASADARTGIASRFSLDMFDAVPADSMAAAYLAMTEVHGER